MEHDDPLLRQWYIRARVGVIRRLGKGIPVEPATTPYLVVPVLGQSNAHGAGVGLDRDGADRPHPLVHQYASSGRDKGRVVAGCDPLFHEIPSKAVGFAPEFGRRLADATGRPVMLVPCARGDTSFAPKNGHTWDPSDRRARVNLYRKAIKAIDKARAWGPGGEVVCVLWHQGESDVPLMSATAYAAKLDSLIDDLRRRYGADLPVVIGQMVPEEIEHGHANYRNIDAVHAGTPARKPRTAYVEGPRDSHNVNEMIHYDAVGQRDLGRRMWEAYQCLRTFNGSDGP